MPLKARYCLVLSCFFAVSVWGQQAPALRLNDIQIIGSHNSYHSGIAAHELEYLRKTNPQAAEALDYKHPALKVQLDAGVRQLEIDIYADTHGGLFAHPAAPGLMKQAGFPPDPPFDPNGIMSKPGFKVLHVQDFDFRSNCEPFVACLGEIRNWSKAHTDHLPLFVLLENKDRRPRIPHGTIPEPLTTATFDALEAEIRSVFSRSELIVPDDVRGAHRTLEEAVLSSGWPTLESARGKVVFLLDQRRVSALYTEGHPSLEGRLLFTNEEPGRPDAAFIEVNNATADASLIPSLVRKGYLVRTMTDPSPERIRANDTRRRDAAMASGAQILSTDYPFDEPAASGYAVGFEHGNARCNPVRQAAACTASELAEHF
jgi:hypothetical protein